jgi:hypothetical protein
MPKKNSDQKEYRKIGDLKPWEKNPRSVTPGAIDRLKKQVTKLGQYKPVLITKDGSVIGGNMRLKAYQELGIEDVWVHVVPATTEKEILEYLLSDNDRAGYYDEQALAELSMELDLRDMDYHVDLGEPATLAFLRQQRELSAADRGQDQNMVKDKLASFLNNPKKQITLFFMPAEYTDFLAKLEAFKAKHDTLSNVEAVLKLLDIHEAH